MESMYVDELHSAVNLLMANLESLPVSKGNTDSKYSLQKLKRYVDKLLCAWQKDVNMLSCPSTGNTAIKLSLLFYPFANLFWLCRNCQNFTPSKIFFHKSLYPVILDPVLVGYLNHERLLLLLLFVSFCQKHNRQKLPMRQVPRVYS